MKPVSLAVTLALLGASVIAPETAVATQYTYTQSPTGGNTVALGYPVPLPVDSLTPVEGFRSYNSLHARHQQLDTDSLNVSAETIGSSYHGRTIWAYTLSDPDDNSSEGLIAEGGMLQNGGIHAREWQTPEVLTHIFETLVANEADRGLHQYLLENTRIVLIPVLNVDGFLQTQRYPDRFMLSTFADDPNGWPRDGRMRRKNMRSVDEDLSTEADNLFGIDLNRNNSPWWATSNRSSTNTRSLVYHGSNPASEPEIHALQQAAALFSTNQLRFYIDTHSFSKLYYLSRNGNSRRDAIAITLGEQMAAATGNSYVVSPDPINSGMGTTDEYFTYNHNIPAYTLEIEPRDSSAEYGGFGVTHDGFILPANQINRVKTELTRAALLGYYRQSGAPALIAAEVRDTTDTVHATMQWTPTSADTRGKTRSAGNNWTVGGTYRLTLDFNKPMRVRDGTQTVVNYRGQSVTLSPNIRLLAQHRDGRVLIEPLPTTTAGWCQGDDCRRYNSDRYRVDFVWPLSWTPAELVNVRVEVSVADFTGANLDANPETVLFWQDGHWNGYEDHFRVAGDNGGADAHLFLISSGEPPVYNGGINVPPLQLSQALDYQFASTAFTDPEDGVLTYELRSDPTPLPSWLQFDAANRRLTGTPTAAGAFSLQIVAIDAEGNRAIAPVTITVTATDTDDGGGGGAVPLLLSMALLGLCQRRRHR